MTFIYPNSFEACFAKLFTINKIDCLREFHWDGDRSPGVLKSSVTLSNEIFYCKRYNFVGPMNFQLSIAPQRNEIPFKWDYSELCSMFLFWEIMLQRVEDVTQCKNTINGRKTSSKILQLGCTVTLLAALLRRPQAYRVVWGLIKKVILHNTRWKQCSSQWWKGYFLNQTECYLPCYSSTMEFMDC